MKKFELDKLIISEDDSYIALDKPNFFSFLDNKQSNIYKILKTKYPGIKILFNLNHKLSGIVIFAKGEKPYKNILNQFIRKKLSIEYHLLVSGKHYFKNEIIRKSINEMKYKSIIDIRKGKNAKTIFNTMQIYKDYTLLKATTQTDRKDQVNVHAKYIKARIIGDKKYGGKDIYLSDIKKTYKKKKEQEEIPISKTIMIHLKKINFKNIDNKDSEITAEYSKDFTLVLKYLNKFSTM